ncbi:hypothetical protein P6U16_00325 [Rhizobium sp. 32-5/1]|uniref:hypothetical protein n=1 Tax=Rhizobium sp. 32-5/1 TaxID=3019602 RepID=UPI00240D144E|nr:hypothetical protein [Rhizobium sp. 32-5/1]WEZ83381.1 hypothetical protein P6U16_00325 [Rhizobium sp. 32-5/1]
MNDEAVGSETPYRLEERRGSARDGLSGLNGDPAKTYVDDNRNEVRKLSLGPVSIFGVSIGLWAALLPVGILAAIVGGASDIPVLLQFGKVMILLVITPLVLFLFSDFGQIFGFWPHGNKASKPTSENGVEN